MKKIKLVKEEFKEESDPIHDMEIGAKPIKCPKCNGLGQIIYGGPDIGDVEDIVSCYLCKGKGKIYKENFSSFERWLYDIRESKLVKEEFKNESDPIDDMGIGIAGISSHQVWVVINKGTSDIDQIFLNKNKAIRAAEEENKQVEAYFSKYGLSREIIEQRKYTVKTLYEAIEVISDKAYNSGADSMTSY